MSMPAGSKLGRFSKGECRLMNAECFALSSKLLQVRPRAFLGFWTVAPFSVTLSKQVAISFVAVSRMSESDNSNSFNHLEGGGGDEKDKK